MTRKGPQNRPIQKHHLSYSSNEVRHVFKAEHEVLTSLSKLLKTKPSLTFIEELKAYTDRFASNPNIKWYDEEEMAKMYKKKLFEKRK